MPIDTAWNSYSQIEKTGHVIYPWMGVTLETLTPDLAKALKYKVTEGALVTAVRPAARRPRPASRGGTSTVTVQGEQFTVGGDVITAVNGNHVASAADLVKAVAAFKPGDTVTLTINRQGATSQVKVKLGTRPANV